MSDVQVGLDLDPGERVARIFGAEPPFERSTRFEPNLLPHLARLCHDFSIGDVLMTADILGRDGGHPQGWPQLWESTFSTLLARFGPDEIANRGRIESLDLEIETYRLLAGEQIDEAGLRDRINREGGWNSARLLARVLSVRPDASSIEALIVATDPRDFDGESVRRLLISARQVDLELPGDWVDRAIGLTEWGIERARAAHALTALPTGDQRTELVSRIVNDLDWEPPWYVALLASRLAGDLSTEAADRMRGLVDDPVWSQLVDGILADGSAESLDHDVRRAHPFAVDLDAIARPHESTEPAAQDDSAMATVKQVERRIEKIEGFRVQILHGRDRRDVSSDKGGVSQYPYGRALKGSDNVRAWREHRFAKHYPGFEIQVLDASGHVVHGATLLTTVRDTYLPVGRTAVDIGLQMIDEWGGAGPPETAAPAEEAPPVLPAGPPVQPAGPPVRRSRPDLLAGQAPRRGRTRLRGGGLFDRVRGRVRRGSARNDRLENTGPPEEPDDAPDDRRLGVDAYLLDGTRLEHVLVRDRATNIEVSIGPPGTATEQLTYAIPLDFTDVKRRSLPVRFFDGVAEQWSTLSVLKHPSSRAEAAFRATPSGDRFNALVIVYAEDGSTVIEAAAFAADVVADDSEASPTDASTFELVRVPVAGLSALVAEPNDTAGSVVASAEYLAASTDLPVVPLAAGTSQGLAPLLSTFRTTAGNFVATDGGTDITPALIAAATFGFQLRRSYQLDASAAFDRIQVVSLDPADVFPLELCYDADPPKSDAHVCTSWRKPTEKGRCPDCYGTNDRTVLCPLHFWALSKQIEHYCLPTSGARPTATPTRFDPATEMPAPTTAVIGASDKVLAALAGQRRLERGRT